MVCYKTLLLVGLGMYTLAGARVPAEIDLYGRTLDTLALTKKQLTEARVRLNRERSTLSEGITELRNGNSGNLSPLKRMKLENLLADAKDKADSLTLVSAALACLVKQEAATLTDGLKMAALLLERPNLPAATAQELGQLTRAWQDKLDRLRAGLVPATSGIDLAFNEQDDLFTLQNKKLILDQWLAELRSQQDSLTASLRSLQAELTLYRAEKEFSFNPGDPDGRERGIPYFTNQNEVYSLEMRLKLDEDRLQEVKEQLHQAARLAEQITETIRTKTK